jgi:uncharacterized protein (TIGR03435 family)
VNYLSQQLSPTVVDKTSLSGHYDVKLEWKPERGEGGPEALGLPPAFDTASPPPRLGRRFSPPFKNNSG